MVNEYKAVLCKTLTQLNITVNNMIKDGWEPSGELIIGDFPVKKVFENEAPIKNKYTGEYHPRYEIHKVPGYLQVMIRFEGDD